MYSIYLNVLTILGNRSGVDRPLFFFLSLGRRNKAGSGEQLISVLFCKSPLSVVDNWPLMASDKRQRAVNWCQ